MFIKSESFLCAALANHQQGAEHWTSLFLVFEFFSFLSYILHLTSYILHLTKGFNFFIKCEFFLCATLANHQQGAEHWTSLFLVFDFFSFLSYILHLASYILHLKEGFKFFIKCESFLCATLANHQQGADHWRYEELAPAQPEM